MKLIKWFKWLFKKKKVESYNISCGYEYHSSISGGDILPGDVPVFASQTWEVNVYQGYFDNSAQWIVCSLTDKYWWLIPFTYDKFIFELPKIKFDLRGAERKFTDKDLLNFVYNYAKDTKDYERIKTDGITAFLVNSKPVQLYDTSENEYSFKRLTGDYDDSIC